MIKKAIENTSNITMDWGNLSFKGKDIIVLVIYIATLAFAVAGVKNSLDSQGQKIEALQLQMTEAKTDGKDDGKANTLILQSLQNQINANATQIQLIKQDVQTLKDSNNRNNAN